MLTDGQGNIIKTYEYDAFGVEWDAVDTDNNPFRYCGEYFDKETKTVYLRARYYDSAYGRFTQQDGWEYANFGDPLSLNLYMYCWNNPLRMVDKDGHFPVVLALIGVGLLNAGISGLDMGISAKMCGQDFWKGFGAGAIGGVAGFATSALTSKTGGLSILLGRGVNTATSGILNELFQNGNFDSMDWGALIADIGIDVLLSGLYCDQMLKIDDPYIQALINGIIDSVIDVTETSLFYTEAAKSAIHGAGKNNIMSESSEYDNDVKTADDGLELYPHLINGR